VRNILTAYLKKIFEVTKKGDATESSYYSCLEELFSNYAESIIKKKIHVTTIPQKTDAGNPDFRVWDGKQHIVGYIEAKAPTVKYLDQIEDTEQLKRYLNTFPNLILTNFFEFRLYRDGGLIDNVQIARPYVIHKLGTIPPVEKEQEFFNLLERFFSFSLPKTYTAKTLAVELAKRTRFLKEQVIIEELKKEETPPLHPPLIRGELKGGVPLSNGRHKGVYGFYEAFQKFLIHGLTKEDFADLYSQTITYGLFAARTRHTPPSPPYKGGELEGGFNRRLAFDYIPRTIGILRDVFKFISLEDLPAQMEWIVDDISEVLSVADVKQILHKFYHEGKGSDPIIHFYETFLAEYDPKEREKRGVYYTPEPVVSYIVRSLNIILKEYFGKRDGFASDSVTVLDPAAGTLTFLAETSKLAVEEFTSRYGEGGKKDLIKTHILKNYYAFELMMAPYAVGHLKMSFLLEELGYKLQKDDRFKLYLTNTLEMEELEQTSLPGMASLSEESHLAGKIKKEKPILVILGNPPYSYHSTNIGDWIKKEIKAYYQVSGMPLGEKNPKGLQDDYVKFIRFAQWKIEQAGEGVLGFITNHSYLDNPTFRGLRQSLMQSFDEIYLLDLHGNSLKKEKCPDGSKDENVFDIQQGVAIALFVKMRNENVHKISPNPSLPKRGKIEGGFECKVRHSEVWGLRENKYDWLDKHDIKTTKWKKIDPKSEFYLFIPRDEKLLKLYETYPKITDIFPVNSVGIVTSRDNFVIDFDKTALKRRIMQFRDKRMPDEIIQQSYDLKDNPNWKLEDARENIINDENWEQALTKILYRPFDEQWIFYHDAVIERSRKEVMRHMTKENLGLITVRQVAEGIFNHVFITNDIINYRVTLSAKGGSYLFPLYLYQSKDNPIKKSFSSIMMLFEEQAEYGVKKPNLSPEFIEKLTKTYTPHIPPYQGGTKGGVSPEQIFYYIYAVLYSNIYRTKYAEFLKIDFPRIPFTKDYKLFKKLGEYGEKLIALHLLKSSELDSPVARFQGKGDNKVEKLRYIESPSPSSPHLKGGENKLKVEKIPSPLVGEGKGEGEINRLYINQTQYFEGMHRDVWEYQIGGYQVCEKWLKDRKVSRLSLDEIKHYCRIIAALTKTIDIQEKIDRLYQDLEKEMLFLW
jgi:hypothetical protein